MSKTSVPMGLEDSVKGKRKDSDQKIVVVGMLGIVVLELVYDEILDFNVIKCVKNFSITSKI